MIKFFKLVLQFHKKLKEMVYEKANSKLSFIGFYL